MQQIQFLIIFIILFTTCKQNADPRDKPVQVETKNITNEVSPLLEINLENALEEGALTSSEMVAVSYDPVFKRAKKYEAIPLKPYLESLIRSQNLDTSNTEIVFLCKDGYNPSMPLGKVMSSDAYLAIKDLEATVGKSWMDTLDGKWSPFYLIWTGAAQGEKGYTWPYGLKFLQFIASDEIYKAAFPQNPVKMAGFELYKEKCMKCHSVNRVGGIMGPEMNVPKNITEYWQKEDIFAFVKNPYSYRYNSKMPPVEGILDAELEKIYDYLKYMKEQKTELE